MVRCGWSEWIGNEPACDVREGPANIIIEKKTHTKLWFSFNAGTKKRARIGSIESSKTEQKKLLVIDISMICIFIYGKMPLRIKVVEQRLNPCAFVLFVCFNENGKYVGVVRWGEVRRPVFYFIFAQTNDVHFRCFFFFFAWSFPKQCGRFSSEIVVS